MSKLSARRENGSPKIVPEVVAHSGALVLQIPGSKKKRKYSGKNVGVSASRHRRRTEYCSISVLCAGESKRSRFVHVMATSKARSEDRVEKLGPEKLVNLDGIYGDQNYNLECAISGHVDDLPLMQLTKPVFRVCPDQDTLIGLAPKKLNINLFDSGQ